MVQLLLIQQSLLENYASHGRAGLKGLLGNIRRLLISHVGRKGRNDSNAVFHQGAASLLIGRDAGYAVVHKCPDRIGQSVDGLEHTVENNGLKGIQLQLSGFRRHGDGQVISNDVKGNLVYHLRYDGIDLARHDGRSVLPDRKIDFIKACFWS